MAAWYSAGSCCSSAGPTDPTGCRLAGCLLISRPPSIVSGPPPSPRPRLARHSRGFFCPARGFRVQTTGRRLVCADYRLPMTVIDCSPARCRFVLSFCSTIIYTLSFLYKAFGFRSSLVQCVLRVSIFQCLILFKLEFIATFCNSVQE